MTDGLPDKVLQKRMRLQMASLESPSDFSNSSRTAPNEGVSPMTALANNLGDTNLESATVSEIKRRIAMDSPSNFSSPSPGSSIPGQSADTPLSTITNIPKRMLLASGNKASNNALLSSDSGPDSENKENIPIFSPTGKRKNPLQSQQNSSSRRLKGPLKSISETGVNKVLSFGATSPVKSVAPEGKPAEASNDNSSRLQAGGKRSHMNLFEDKDESSRDSGLGSQSLFGPEVEPEPEKSQAKRRKFDTGSMDDILRDCSPGKEDGIMPLSQSPVRDDAAPAARKQKEESSRNKLMDGFDVDQLSTIEEEVGVSPKMDFKSLFSNKILQQPEATERDNSSTPKFPTDVVDGREGTGEVKVQENVVFSSRLKRPPLRRSLSMMDSNSYGNFSKGGGQATTAGESSSRFPIPGFKRPEPPKESLVSGFMPLSKKSKMSSLAIPSFSSASTSSVQKSESKTVDEPSIPHLDLEMSIKKSCELKEVVENILPDSSRLYALPTITENTKHPGLRSISCDTLAKVMNGEFDNVIRSFRIIDARYAFEYEGGHIRGAENWQHGEDDKFLSAFLPETPLPVVPTYDPDNEEKRDILIFHCEFSSQRGPDFLKKLRERDRTLNHSVYPGLHYPECYLLHLGYKEFFSRYPNLCTGHYTTMIDPRHEQDLRKMRAKSKSWAGGTVTRTGRMGRLHF